MPQSVLLHDLFTKPVVVTFEQPHASSGGEAILLKAAETRYGLIAGLALVAELSPRAACRLSHGVSALTSARCIPPRSLQSLLHGRINMHGHRNRPRHE